jgi:sulfur-oxidizing protein SoxX
VGSAGVGILALGWNKISRSALKALVVAAAQAGALAGCAADRGAAAQPVGHSDAIAEPLTPTPGDAARGREIVMGRDGNCLFCHAIPEGGERFMGNIGPALAGVGSRLSAAQLRQRIVDPTKVKPDITMPAYHRTEGLDQVAQQYRGRPILDAQQVEDVIAYLLTLK